MGKASNQEDGVIACIWAFLPASRRPVHLVEWQQKRAYGLGWMPVMEKWLAEASFLLRLLMAPSSCPKESGNYLPSSEPPLLGEAVVISICHQLGLAQPPMPLCLPLLPGLAPKSLQKYIP